MFALLRLGLKAGISTSAVYFTVDKGVWKDSEKTAVLYNDLTSQAGTFLAPYIEKVPLPDIPRTGSFVTTSQNAWNSGVKSTCRFLVASPKCAVGYVKKGYKYVEEQVQAAATAPPAS